MRKIVKIMAVVGIVFMPFNIVMAASGVLKGKAVRASSPPLALVAQQSVPAIDGLGALQLPEGVVAARIAHLLLPDRKSELSTLVGMKKWAYAKDTYIAIACVVSDQSSKKRALDYGGGKPICAPWLKDTVSEDYNVAIGVVKYGADKQLELLGAVYWSDDNHELLSASWEFSNLYGPVGINYSADPSTAVAKTIPIDPQEIYKFDLAEFKISDRITAFGVRSLINEGYAGGGAAFHILTLFAMIDGKLTKVLSEPIAYARNSASDWNKDGTRTHESVDDENIVALLPTKTAGYYDLRIKSKLRPWFKTFHWNKEAQRYMPIFEGR